MLYFPLSSLHIYFPDSSDDHDSDLPSQRQGYLKKKKPFTLPIFTAFLKLTVFFLQD